MDNAQIEYSPTFSATETNDKFLADLEDEAEVEARRLLYVAMTRARDKLVLEWPAYLSGKAMLSYWSILVDQCGAVLKEESLDIGESAFKCINTKGGSEIPSDVDLDSEEEVISLPTIGRRAIQINEVPEILIPDNVSPSTMESKVGEVRKSVVEVFQYGADLNPDVRLTGAELGTFLHQCFEILGDEFLENGIKHMNMKNSR